MALNATDHAIAGTGVGAARPYLATSRTEGPPGQTPSPRATLLKSAAGFAEIWPQIESLRVACLAEDDVLLHPLHFLASLDTERRSSCSVACWDRERLVGLLFAT